MTRALLLLIVLALPAAAREAPTPREADAVLTASQRYFVQRIEDPDAVLGVASEELRETIGDDALLARWDEMADRIGRPDSLRVVRIVAYPASERTRRRRLVAIDWQSTFTLGQWGCGYLLWEVGRGAPRLLRSEGNYVPLAAFDMRSAEERVVLARELGCAR